MLRSVAATWLRDACLPGDRMGRSSGIIGSG
jgi:hypothetical protein